MKLDSNNSQSVETLVSRIAEGAMRNHDVPEEVARYAARATETAVRSWRSRNRALLERRATAYFDAVARRRVLSKHPRSTAATRVVVESIIADLADSGRRPREIWDELCRGWTNTMSEELAREYERRLCA